MIVFICVAATEVKGWFPRQSISVPDRRQRSNERAPPSPPEVKPLSSQTSQSSESDGQEEEAVEVSKADGSGNAAGLRHAKKPKKYKHLSSPNAVKSTSYEEMLVDITGDDSVKHKFPGRHSNDDGQLRKGPRRKAKELHSNAKQHHYQPTNSEIEKEIFNFLKKYMFHFLIMFSYMFGNIMYILILIDFTNILYCKYS